MKTIKLKNGGETIVDDDTYEWASKYRWTKSNSGYAKRIEESKGKTVNIYLHREIVGLPRPGNGGKKQVTDHIDRNKLNNLSSNLRICSRSQNHANACKRSGYLSKYKGVSFRKSKNKFVARTYFNNKPIYLGYFNSAESAARAYDIAVIELYGEFALTNESLGLFEKHLKFDLTDVSP